MIITISFQNQKARFSVQMREEDAILMIKNSPRLSEKPESHLESTTLAEEIFKELGIVPLSTAGAVICVHSFEYWDSLQDPDKIIAWGSTTADKNSQVFDHAVAYKDVPFDIKRMFYNQYVHIATNPA